MSKPEYSQKPGLMLLSDNGPDFNPLSLLNAIYFYRLFRALKCDFMSVFTHAAHYSAFNCIEHLWSPLSDKVGGIAFSSCRPGDDKPPAKPAGLND